MRTLSSPTGTLTFDPSVGNIPALSFTWEGQELIPLHKAAWADDPAAHAAEDVPWVDRKLAGDFACAPFGKSDVEPSPPHGWTANSSWSVETAEKGELRCTLDRPVMGATITKTLKLAADAPLLIQEHTIESGAGGLTFAHHPMIDVSQGARVSFSPKRLALTNPFPIVPGHHAFDLDAETRDLSKIPASDGSTLDLHALPIANETEDFLCLFEAQAGGLGWTAVVREQTEDIVFVLKDVATLPLTMLWHSNGARKDFPWNGQNRGILGIEDGRTAGSLGHKAALSDNPVKARGVPTAFELADGRRHTIKLVIGAVPNTRQWREVTNIAVETSRLVLTGETGEPITLPFDPRYLT